jgi:hypothetical protein
LEQKHWEELAPLYREREALQLKVTAIKSKYDKVERLLREVGSHMLVVQQVGLGEFVGNGVGAPEHREQQNQSPPSYQYSSGDCVSYMHEGKTYSGQVLGIDDRGASASYSTAATPGVMVASSFVLVQYYPPYQSYPSEWVQARTLTLISRAPPVLTMDLLGAILRSCQRRTDAPWKERARRVGRDLRKLRGGARLLRTETSRLMAVAVASADAVLATGSGCGSSGRATMAPDEGRASTMESYSNGELALTPHQTDLLSLVLRGVRHERNMHRYRTQQHGRRRKRASHNATEQVQREVSALHRLCHPSNEDGQAQEEDEVTLTKRNQFDQAFGL